MGIRSTVGSVLESAIGRERTNTIRSAERKARNALAKRLAMEPPKKPPAKPASKPAARKPRPNRFAPALAAVRPVRLPPGAENDSS